VNLFRLVTLIPEPLGLAGIGCLAAGIWQQYGMNFGLVTLGGLLILEALT